jgi:methionyl-tRNA formyltransferase
MKDYPRIIFFGTPDFAVESLDSLIRSGYNVTGVVTAPDKPSGRGMQLKSSPVKHYALKMGLPVLQPENLKDLVFIKELKELNPDLQVVVAFRMLPVEVWSIPTLGTFNLHASLLPHYRGAAPINWAIINGEKETGVTTFFINEKIDTGNIILQKSLTIGEEETAGDLHDRLMIQGAELVKETVAAIANHEVQSISQDLLLTEGIPTKKAPKIFHENCRINWNDNVRNTFNFIRGLSPHPCSFTSLTSSDGTSHYIKVIKAIPEFQTHSFPAGKVFSDEKSYLKISVQDGFIHLKEIQPAGRKTLSIADFLRGVRTQFT